MTSPPCPIPPHIMCDRLSYPTLGNIYIPMEYVLQYLLTDRERAKLFSKLVVQPSNIPSRTRPFVRLFLKVWAGAVLANRTVLARKPRLHALKLAASISLGAGSYRYIYTQLRKPTVAAFVAGLILTLGLPSEAAAYLTLYLSVKLCEWGYNLAEDHQLLEWKPKIIGTWLLFPLAFSHLFHTLLEHPDKTPSSFKKIMVALSNNALAPRVPGSDVTTDTVLRGISRAAGAGFPDFRSPMLNPQSTTAPSAILSSTAPQMFNPPIQGLPELLSVAHLGNTTVLGALVHPGGSTNAAYMKQTLARNVSRLGKYLIPLYLVRAYYLGKPVTSEVVTALRTCVTYAVISTVALGGIELSRYWLGPKMPRSLRFRLVGGLSGLWAVLIQGTGHAQFLYATRMAVLSALPARYKQLLGCTLLPVTLALTSLMAHRWPTALPPKLVTWLTK